MDDEMELSAANSHVCFDFETLSLLIHFSGHCIIGGDGHSLVVSNLRDGIDLYSLPPSQPLRTFKHNITRNVPLVISSAFDGRITIVGSDNGYARMYDPQMGMMTGVLQHGNGKSYHQSCYLFSSLI